MKLTRKNQNRNCGSVTMYASEGYCQIIGEAAVTNSVRTGVVDITVPAPSNNSAATAVGNIIKIAVDVLKSIY